MIKAMPDIDVLRQRLSKVASTPRNKNPKSMTLQQLIAKLRKRLVSLNPEDIQDLSDYIPSSNLLGLDTKIRVQLLQFCDALEGVQ